MKAHFSRIPVSSWKDDLYAPSAALFPKTGERGPETAVVIPSSKPEDYYLVPVGKALTASRRLVVIVPPSEFNDQELAWRAAKLARNGRGSVLLVGLANEPVRDSLLRRRMATVCSILRTPHAQTGYQLVFRENWMEALPEILEEGDRVVCLEEHFVNGRLFRDERLAQQIVTRLETPVYVMQGIRLTPEKQLRWTGLKDFLVWVSVLLTLALFLLIQVRIQQTIPGAMGTVAEIVTVLVEVAVVIRIISVGDW